MLKLTLTEKAAGERNVIYRQMLQIKGMEVAMSVQLLDKTRKINKLLHNNNSHKVVFNDICKILSEILLSAEKERYWELKTGPILKQSIS